MRRGFAALTAAERSAMASKGGKAAHELGTAHTFTHEEAVAAGRKGYAAGQGKMTAKQRSDVELARVGKIEAERAPHVIAQRQRMAALGLIDKP